MKQGTSTITTVFSNEVGGFRYEYNTTNQAGSVPSVIQYTIYRNDQGIAGGSKRTQGSTFTFEVYSPVTDEERNAIYAQVSIDLKEVTETSSKINITVTK